MQQFIHTYGKSIITIVVAGLLLAILFGGIYMGSVGISSGIGKASGRPQSNLGEIMDSVKDGEEEASINAVLLCAPEIGVEYAIYKDSLPEDSTLPALITTFNTADEFNVLEVVDYWKKIGHFDEDGQEYDEEAGTIKFNRPGTYYITVEVKKGSATNKKTFKFFIQPEEQTTSDAH